MVEVFDGLTNTFIFIIGLAALALIVLFFIDRYQTRDTVRRNYPVIGRMRNIQS